MMFTNLRMVNFKSWADTGDVRLAPLTVLFGGNSTGKSGLLQMLLLLKQTTESRDRNQVLQTGIDYREKDYVRLGTPKDIAHFDATELSLSVGWNWPQFEPPLFYPVPESFNEFQIWSLEFTSDIHVEEKQSYVSAYTYRQGKRAKTNAKITLEREDAEKYTFDAKLDGTTLSRRRGRPAIVNNPGKCYRIPLEALNNFPDHLYLSDLELQFERQFQLLYYLGPLREFPQRVYYWTGEHPDDVGMAGEDAIQALLATDLNDPVLENLVKMNLATSLEVRPITKEDPLFRVHLKHDDKGHEVLLPDVGFGVSQVLPVLVQCLYAPEHSTIILEHPDLHLHPSAQAGLADFLVEVIKQRKVQLIVESHSEHLLRRLQRRTAEEALSPDEIALYFCDIQDGVSNLEELQLNEFGEISNWPDDFFGDMLGDVIETMESGQNKQIVTDA